MQGNDLDTLTLVTPKGINRTRHEKAQLRSPVSGQTYVILNSSKHSHQPGRFAPRYEGGMGRVEDNL